MSDNIVIFKQILKVRQKHVVSKTSETVVSFDTKRKKPRILRTPRGVFFVSNAFCTPGNAA